ncbi:hypothetical protein J3459_016671 [Metarhizium acridum]|nr:hypothetical protein J3459_016671 [Metarhizium acridum]
MLPGGIAISRRHIRATMSHDTPDPGPEPALNNASKPVSQPRSQPSETPPNVDRGRQLKVTSLPLIVVFLAVALIGRSITRMPATPPVDLFSESFQSQDHWVSVCNLVSKYDHPPTEI